MAPTASKTRKITPKDVTYHKTNEISRQRGQPKRTALIVNPNSCSGLTGKNWTQLYDQIRKVLPVKTIKVAFSKKSGDGTTLAREYLRKGFKEIYAIGGDGTINEVANGFFEENAGIRDGVSRRVNPRLRPINANARLAIVPCGTT